MKYANLWARKNGDVVELSTLTNPNIIWKDGNEFFRVEDKYQEYIDNNSEFDIENKTVVPSIVSVEEKLLSELARIRWIVETGVLNLPNGQSISVDRESRTMISDCYASFKEGFITTTKFKTNSGWIDIDFDAITMIASLVTKHVNSCFLAEMKVNETILSLDSVDEMLSIDLYTSFKDEYFVLMGFRNETLTQ